MRKRCALKSRGVASLRSRSWGAPACCRITSQKWCAPANRQLSGSRSPDQDLCPLERDQDLRPLERDQDLCPLENPSEFVALPLTQTPAATRGDAKQAEESMSAGHNRRRRRACAAAPDPRYRECRRAKLPVTVRPMARLMDEFAWQELNTKRVDPTRAAVEYPARPDGQQ